MAESIRFGTTSGTLLMHRICRPSADMELLFSLSHHVRDHPQQPPIDSLHRLPDRRTHIPQHRRTQCPRIHGCDMLNQPPALVAARRGSCSRSPPLVTLRARLSLALRAVHIQPGCKRSKFHHNFSLGLSDPRAVAKRCDPLWTEGTNGLGPQTEILRTWDEVETVETELRWRRDGTEMATGRNRYGVGMERTGTKTKRRCDWKTQSEMKGYGWMNWEVEKEIRVWYL